MMMPDMDGMELAQAIKADSGLRDMEILVLTSVGEYAAPGKIREAGISASLNKPVRRSQLYNCLLTLTGMDPASRDMRSGKTNGGRKLRGHLLLAEDNPINQEVSRSMLQKLGCSLDIVENGREALKALSAKRYDLVLMDCQMPEMDGYLTTRVIREKEKLGEFGAEAIRIVALTAHAMAGDREQCLAAGMDDYLRKPFTLDQLHQTLTRWLPPEKQLEKPGVSFETPAKVCHPPDSNVQVKEASPRRPQCLDRNILDDIRSLQTDNAPDILARVIDIYMKQSPLLLERLRDAISRQDPAAIESAAHSFKSGNANVGALEMAALCSELEQLGRTKRIDNALEMLARVEETYPSVLDALKAEWTEGGLPSIGHSEERPLILIADDDTMIRVMGRARLESLGFSLVEAENGEEAVAGVQDLQPKSVRARCNDARDGRICDMPGAEGNAGLCAYSGPHGHRLEDVESINRAYEAGATDFVTKPINWVVFGHRVRYMWRASMVGDELRRSENKPRTLVNAMPDLMFQIQKDGTIQDYKLPNGLQTSWDPGELCGKNIDETFGVNSPERRISKHVTRAIETGEMQVCEHQSSRAAPSPPMNPASWREKMKVQ